LARASSRAVSPAQAFARCRLARAPTGIALPGGVRRSLIRRHDSNKHCITGKFKTLAGGASRIRTGASTALDQGLQDLCVNRSATAPSTNLPASDVKVYC
jgi:hypothetical protein